MKTLVIIDGKSVFYRGYYAMGNLSRSDGTPTGGVYGFAAIAMELVNDLRPDRVVVAWDSKTSTSKRKALFKDYKAGRIKPPDDFYTQIPLLKELISALGWSFVECDDYEADDIIGTLSKQADDEKNWLTYIISSDLDMLQIVDENTIMYRIKKGFTDLEEIDIPAVEQRYGIKKSQFLDLKALKGDTSDNIPGVAGIGEKTAAKLLNEYDTLDGVYENIDNIKGSIKQKLLDGKDSAYLSKQLAKIMFDAPVELAKLPDFTFNPEKIKQGLEKLEFRSLIHKFGLTGTFSENKALAPSTDSEPPEMPLKSLPEGLILAWDIKSAMKEDEKIAENILKGADFWDLGQADFILNPLRRSGNNYFAFDPENPPKTAISLYWEQLSALKKNEKLLKLLLEFDFPAIPVLYKMEKAGMKIDRSYFERLKTEFDTQTKKIEHEIWELAGESFNLNSPIQLSEVLFFHLKLPVKGIKKTTRGYSTGAKELLKLAKAHPIIPKIIEYREVSKLLNTYITPLPILADKNDRIHTTFTQDVTSTGRLSSVNPNLQNIPVRTEEGKRIRKGFVADEGKILVSADYSQFELRLAAVLAGDQPLIRDFNANIDIHTKTASEAFNVPFDKVKKSERRAAKVINFGILYGMSVKGLADAADMSMIEAKNFIDTYFELRKPLRVYLDKILEQAKTAGFVETYFGRRRETPDVKSSNFLVRAAAERAAKNMPIQGTEADLMKRAMIKVDQSLPKGANLIMQVHDSLIVECPKSACETISGLLKEIMENIAPELPIKLAVEVTTGDNWGDL